MILIKVWNILQLSICFLKLDLHNLIVYSKIIEKPNLSILYFGRFETMKNYWPNRLVLHLNLSDFGLWIYIVKYTLPFVLYFGRCKIMKNCWLNRLVLSTFQFEYFTRMYILSFLLHFGREKITKSQWLSRLVVYPTLQFEWSSSLNKCFLSVFSVCQTLTTKNLCNKSWCFIAVFVWSSTISRHQIQVSWIAFLILLLLQGWESQCQAGGAGNLGQEPSWTHWGTQV